MESSCDETSVAIVSRLDDGSFMLRVRCGKGTYIRTLCADIGASLGCGGIMSALCRTEAGGFSIENSVRIADLRNESDDALISHLLPTESLFASLPAVFLPPFYVQRLCFATILVCFCIYQNNISKCLN